MANARLQDFQKFKRNPDLFAFKMLEELKRETREEAKELAKKEIEKMREEFEAKMKEIGLKPKSRTEEVEGTVQGLHFLRGPKGDEGKEGEQGPKPIAGVDYPIPKHGEKGDPGIGLPGPAGIDGKTPIKGVDYFTDKEVAEIGDKVSKITAEELPPKLIRDKLQSLTGEERLDASAIKGLKRFIDQRKPTMLGGGGQGRWVAEVPSGTVNGSNDAFTLTETPAANSLILQVNGVIQRPGSSREYALSGKTITFNTNDIPQTGDTLFAFYMTGHAV